ncbi:MAG: FtsX-like permease family protein [Phycisphaerae bacterium]|nr:ABC transporter permease [Phycisphaerae bacterium]MCZ2401436.1 FtsX-like permease family protein [Phycisphaerae bacterium]
MALPLYYNWRNLLARKLSSGLTFVVVAVVVFVLTVLLSFAAGISASLGASGHPANIVVLKPGATAESTSIILPEEGAKLIQTPGLARDSSGELLLSAELSVQAQIPRQNGRGATANVAVRGIDDVGLRVHPEVRLTSGRWFRQGALEAVVGRAARERFAGLAVGERLPLGRVGSRLYEIVGTFEAGGGAFDSEIWAPRTMLTDSYERPFLSSVVLRVEPGAIDAAIRYIDGPAVNLAAKTEPDYYRELSSKTREIVVLTSVLVGIMGIGAAFAVANTMYATVDARRREIAMLRTIGFARGAIYASFMVESLLLCGLACAAGLAASLLLNGARQDFLSDTTWTVLAYELRITPAIVATSAGLAACVGSAGALFPAWRAAHVPVIQALRKG